MVIGSVLALSSVLIAAVSQIFLKRAAIHGQDKGFIHKFLNFTVIMAYAMMFASSLCSLFSLRYLELNLMPVFQATSFFWIALFSKLLLKEEISKQTAAGIIIIFLWIIVYLL